MPRVDKLNYFVDEDQNFRDRKGFRPTNGSEKRPENSDQVAEQIIDLTPYVRKPKYSRKDVVLPKSTEYQFDLVQAELKHYRLIYKVWKMGEKHKHDTALTINLQGLPGVGKTMAAEALAHENGKKLLVVPYSQIESKYVGETPKNIQAIFEFLRRYKDVIALFDEADSFLGKRLENVTQSADAAVNLTRSVMLTELSQYDGIVIFATNLIRNYDPAFISRIRWQIQFDLPDEEARAKIWQAQIPSELPLTESVDFTQLASQFSGVSGRDIKKAVLQAVVTAASEEKPDTEKRVTQSHFAQAMEQVIAAKKAAEKIEQKLTPVTGNVELPPQPPTTESEPPA